MDISDSKAEGTAKPKRVRKSRAKAKPDGPANLALADSEETPQSKHRKKLAAERESRKRAIKVQKRWYERNGKKVLLKTLMSNGNVHSSFVCMDSKKTAVAIAKLKEQPEGKLL